MSETCLRALWLVPLLPAAGCVALALGRQLLSKRAIALLACGAILLSFVVALGAAVPVLTGSLDQGMSAPGLAIDSQARSVEVTAWSWLTAGPARGAGPGQAGDSTRTDGRPEFLSRLSVPMGFYLDPLSAVLILVVTGVGFLIHVYAASYMWDEAGFGRFFTYLNLFVAMMLVLVLGSSYLVAFVGWEGVGLCSYLLIGYYHESEIPPRAGLKAFVVNRVGDFGFILGLLLMLITFGTLRFSEVFPRMAAAPHFAGSGLAAALAALLLVGAMGKSAQFPLHVWLPDAMAGPTPVSALIHAATMVTAGVYLIVRSNVLFQAAPAVSAAACLIGAVTAVLAATIALVQNDIKKVLAYSTVSQLGYMFIAAGAGAYGAALFHLVTHAFFKALLFLGAGSVSHALGGELDARRMGGLRTVLPHTHRVMVVATLAIAGIPPLSGFFSKEAILTGVFTSALPAPVRYGAWALAVAGAALTAFYMFRMYLLVFWGAPRWSPGVHPHESPPVMIAPLWVLAALAAAGGVLGLPRWIPGAKDAVGEALRAVIHAPGALVAGAHELDTAGEGLLVALAVAMGVGGLLMAFRWYGLPSQAPARAAVAWPRLHRFLFGKWRIDEAQDALVVAPVKRLADVAGAFDRSFVDGRLVEAPGLLAATAGEIFRGLSSGKVRTHALAVLAGAVALVAWAVFR